MKEDPWNEKEVAIRGLEGSGVGKAVFWCKHLSRVGGLEMGETHGFEECRGLLWAGC